MQLALSQGNENVVTHPSCSVCRRGTETVNIFQYIPLVLAHDEHSGEGNGFWKPTSTFKGLAEVDFGDVGVLLGMPPIVAEKRFELWYLSMRLLRVKKAERNGPLRESVVEGIMLESLAF
jgi:hypothetical protein